MIMPKNRDTGGTIELPKPARAALRARGDQTVIAGGRTSVNTGANTVELSFVLPLREGMAVLEQLRSGARTESEPLLMWTGRQGELEIAVRSSAKTTPVKPAEPVGARADMERIDIGDLVINPGRHEVLYKGRAVPQLTFTEFGILHHLARHPGWVFNRHQIVAGVRGEDYPVTDRAVDVQVAGLRKKLGDAAEYVQTVRGVGYRFRD
ncbi:MAG TPA: response regulator transcription factor [Kiritimatiellia bacterium]|nr:response regulator transcription factor [Kiritimatiellia bacterium]